VALSRSSFNKWDWIRGADEKNTPLPLGPTANCRNFGPHYFGANVLYGNPIFVRAYFDPTGLDLRGIEYLGYVQILEVKILGVDVPSVLIGGSLPPRSAALTNTCVDFMGPRGCADATVAIHGSDSTHVSLQRHADEQSE
jgi:hypothetical protein